MIFEAQSTTGGGRGHLRSLDFEMDTLKSIEILLEKHTFFNIVAPQAGAGTRTQSRLRHGYVKKY